MVNKHPHPDTEADRFYEAEFTGDVPELRDPDDVTAFLDQLTARALFDACEDTTGAAETTDSLDDADLIAKFESLYLQERHKVTEAALASGGAALSDVKAWLAAESQFGGDRLFVMTCATRGFRPPLPPGFLRYVAQKLGVAYTVVSAFFALPPAIRFAEEFKSAEKPSAQPIQEDFRAAIARLPIDDALKREWLED
jgi:hypothetical protein